MNEEDYYKVFLISVNGDHAPLLDAVVDNPEIGKFSLRDSAGVDTFDISKQEQFNFLRSKFKPYARIIVYDTTAIESFHKARTWLEENAISSNGSACMLLVGNDHNLDGNDVNKVVNTDTGRELARRFGIPFIETSAEHPAQLEQALTNMTEFIESS